MAAAVEAMAEMGFEPKLVRQKVNRLLKVGTFYFLCLRILIPSILFCERILLWGFV